MLLSVALLQYCDLYFRCATVGLFNCITHSSRRYNSIRFYLCNYFFEIKCFHVFGLHLKALIDKVCDDAISVRNTYDGRV